MYSQNKEEQHILEYFKNHYNPGTLLDIGANDGITFSNSKRLIELGWKAVLVEPSDAGWEKLLELHGSNEKVVLVAAAIGTYNTTGILHESAAHVPGGADRALVSTLKKSEKDRWVDVTFNQKEVDILNYKTLCERCRINVFDFISIDAEGMDLEILAQIDLSATKLLCIEWNLNEAVKHTILQYCAKFGMTRLIYQSPENLLIAR